MNDGQRAAWDRFRREVPWLMESDRALVEIASYLRARIMIGEEVGVGALNQLRMCMAQMGATPADRSKVAVPDEPEKTPPIASSTDRATADAEAPTARGKSRAGENTGRGFESSEPSASNRRWLVPFIKRKNFRFLESFVFNDIGDF